MCIDYVLSNILNILLKVKLITHDFKFIFQITLVEL